MKIKFWGARGSIPVSGKEYIKYGGSTTCVEITSSDGKTIVVDAGTGIRRLGARLLADKTKEINMIFTHSHWDHLLGFPFFKPIYYAGTKINMFGCPFAQKSIKHLLAHTMRPPYFPVKYEDIKVTIKYQGYCSASFCIGNVEIQPILLSHPNQGIGYKFVENGKAFVFLTDNELAYVHPGGLGFDDYAKFSCGADLLVHDAEFTEKEYTKVRTWGHSTFNDAVKLAKVSGVKKLVFWHHNQDRTDSELDKIIDFYNGKRKKTDPEYSAAFEGQEIEL